MKFSKRFRILAALLGGGIVVASSACSVDSLEQATAPQQAPTMASASRGSSGSGQSLSATAAFPDMSADGKYTITLDPQVANTLSFGPSKLEIPAGAICTIGTSGYGASFWDTPCDPQTAKVQLQISISSTSVGPSIDFTPALRFNPLTNVQLTLSAPKVQKSDAKSWVILFCATSTSTTSGKGSGGSGSGNGTKCVNEALTDKDLQTTVNYDLKQLSRRIKHFSIYGVSSGYMLGE